ncbi:MAG: hypothetical protein WB919_02010, partial [Candidatus Sulfotelmatobacter sp.]
MKKLCRWLETLKLKYLVLFLLALTVVVHLAALQLLHIHPTIAFAEMEKIARSLAENGTFANPYKIPTGPTAHHAPIYPLLLSFIFRAFGYGPTAAYAMAVMNIFFAALHYSLLPVLTDAAGIPRVVGVGAGLYGALVPYRINREIRWETTLSALILVVLILITTRWWRTQRPSQFHTFCIGLAWGAGMLSCPILLLVFLLILMFFAVSAWKRQLPEWQLTVAVAALGMVIAVAPWTIRNYRALGGLAFVRSNFGIELDLSNNSEAYPTVVDNITIGYPNNYYHRNHPWANQESAEQVRQLGELGFNRQRLRRSVDWIRGHPQAFAKLCAQRTVMFWFTAPKTQRLKAILLVPWTLVAAWGLWVMLHRHRDLGLLLLATWIAYP